MKRCQALVASAMILAVFMLCAHPYRLEAQDAFSFEEDPTVGLASNRLGLPSQQGTLLGLNGKTIIEGNSGEVKYTYSIDLPGWRGLFKSLQIVYGSNSGFGIFGQGFTDSIPYIERTTRLGTPNASTALRSSIDSDLISLDTQTLRARIEGSFHRYSFEGEGIRMDDGSGRIFRFGVNKDDREAEGTFVTRWSLSEIEDPAGHKVKFVYRKKIGSKSYPDRIFFVEKDGTVSYAVLFEYERLPIAWRSFANGTDQTIDQRVRQLTVFWAGSDHTESELLQDLVVAGAARVSAVKFTYSTIGFSRRSVLSTIQRFGKTDADSTPAYHFSYSQPCVEAAAACGLALNFNETYQMPAGATIGRDSARLLDINSDGVVDLVSGDEVFANRLFKVRLNKGQNETAVWSGLDEPIELPVQNLNFRTRDRTVIDINGDRLPDLLIGSTAHINPGGEKPIWDSRSIILNGLREGFLNDPKMNSWIDLNSDSRTDLVEYVADASDRLALKIQWNTSKDGNLSLSAAKVFSLPGAPFYAPFRLDWADMNGDGLSDPILFTAGLEERQVQYWLNRGNGTFASIQYATLQGLVERVTPRWFDINGDGFTDAIIAAQRLPLRLFVNDGLGNLKPVGTAFSSEIIDFATQFTFGDFNGNGSKDLIVGHNGSRVSIFDPYLKQPVTAPFMLREVWSDLGEKNVYGYASSVQGEVLRRLSDRLPVVYNTIRSWTVSAPRYGEDGKYQTRIIGQKEYLYSDGYFDRIRNEFLGFASVTVRAFQEAAADGNSVIKTRGVSHVTEYFTMEKGGYLHNRIKSQTVRKISTDEIISRTDNDMGVFPLFEKQGIMLPVLKEAKVQQFEGASSIERRTKSCTKLFPDTLLPSQVVRTEYLGGIAYRHTIIDYDKGLDTWAVRWPKQMSLLKPDSKQIYLSKRIHYNYDFCRPETVERLLAENLWQTVTAVSYDENGNIKSTKDATGHEVKFEYKSPGGFLPTETIEEVVATDSTYRSNAEYDFTLGGLMTQLKDPNGHTTRIEYDNLGRVAKWFPADTEEAAYTYLYEFGNFTRPTSIRAFEKGRALPHTDVYDGLMRKNLKLIPSESSWVLLGFHSLDLLGNTRAESQPQALATDDLTQLKIRPDLISYYTTDERSRIQEKDSPAFGGVRAKTSYVYGIEKNQFVISTISPEGDPRRAYTDAFGRTTSTVEINSSGGTDEEATLGFEYDIANRVVRIAMPGQPARNYQYDQAGRLFKVAAADFGSVVIEHNEMDLPLVQRYRALDDQPLFATFNRYDDIHRLVESKQVYKREVSYQSGLESGLQLFEYQYDRSDEGADFNQQNLLGRVASTKIYEGAVYFSSYDKFGNKAIELLRLYDKTFRTEFAYNELGRLTKLTYPDGESLEHVYSERTGLLQSISGLVKQVGRDSLNRVVSLDSQQREDEPQYHYTFGFDDVSGLPIENAIKTSDEIYKHQYTGYDRVGRLTESKGFDLVESSFAKTYKFDKRGQLSEAAISVSEDGKAAIDKILQYEYNIAGEIARLGDKTLTQKRDEKGALMSISSPETGEEWKFTSLGRLVQSNKIDRMGWYHSNLPACMIKGKKLARFAYLPDGKRFAEVKEIDGKTNSTAFVNEYVHYEKEKNNLIKFYWFDGMRLALQSQGKRHFLAHDFDNSGKLEFNSSGGVAGYSDYLPFGQKIINKVSSEATNRYKFAGSMEDAEFDVNQMGSRFYDPSLGSFLSSDLRALTDLSLCIRDMISCNMRSYARNNPIAYLDKDGDIAIWAVGAGVGAAVALPAAIYREFGPLSTPAASNAEFASKIVKIGVSTIVGAAGGAISTIPNVNPFLGAFISGGMAGAESMMNSGVDKFFGTSTEKSEVWSGIATSSITSLIFPVIGKRLGFEGIANQIRGTSLTIFGRAAVLNLVEENVKYTFNRGIGTDVMLNAASAVTSSVVDSVLNHSHDTSGMKNIGTTVSAGISQPGMPPQAPPGAAPGGGADGLAGSAGPAPGNGAGLNPSSDVTIDGSGPPGQSMEFPDEYITAPSPAGSMSGL